jgi:hypothetical protein
MNRFARPLASAAAFTLIGVSAKQLSSFSYCEKAAPKTAPTMASSDGSVKTPVPSSSAVGAQVAPVKQATTESAAAEEDDDDDFELSPEKEDCPFCQHFLQSPCAKQFMRWSKCVDKCKADNTDFVTVCETLTTKLLVCTEKNIDYFKDSMPGDGGGHSEEGKEPSSVDDTAPVAVPPKE